MAIATRRRLLVTALAAACALGGFAAASVDAHMKKGKVIKVVTRRFTFEPSELTLRKGETVTLEFVTKDVLMGFNAPDFATRTDIAPGVVARVTLTPDKAGTFPFLCDVFCGSGHENMNGVIKVVD